MQTANENEVTQLAERIFGGILGTYDTWSIYVGDKLGLYQALADGRPRSYEELAGETEVHPRYVREWLEQQAVTGLLACDSPSLPAQERRYSMTGAAVEVLTNRESLSYLTPFVRLVTSAGIQLPSLLDAYRSGSGVGWEEFGPDMRTGQAEMNRPWFLHALGSEWFPQVPDLQAKLEQGARVADVGCGEGWSSIGFAFNYPDVMVDGYDVDRPSIEAARTHAERYHVADRVAFFAVDAATVDAAESYDLVTAFECIHDLADPVGVLSAMRRLVKPDGAVVVMDERVAENFAGEEGGDVERLMYGFSLFTCLPDGLSHEPSVGTGTVMRPATLASYARSAGFANVEVLPIENDLWRFYRLTF
jgi:SAM-dependent methyltransferase